MPRQPRKLAELDWTVPPRARWFRGWQAVGRLVFRGLFGLEAVGVEHVPATGPCILAANHPSYLEPVFLGAFLPRPPRVMTWDAVFRIPVVSAWARSCGGFPVSLDEGSGAVRAQRLAQGILGAGGMLVIFPEGGRSEPSGEMKPPRHGIGRLAAVSGAPIVCASVLGSWHVWPSDQLLFRCGKVRIVFHSPIVLDEDERRERERDRGYHAEISERVDARIRPLVERARRDPACTRSFVPRVEMRESTTLGIPHQQPSC